MDRYAHKRTRAFLDPSVERRRRFIPRPHRQPVGYRRVSIGFGFRP